VVPEGHPECLYGKTFVLSGVLDSLYRNSAFDLVKKHSGKITQVCVFVCVCVCVACTDESVKIWGISSLTHSYILTPAHNKTDHFKLRVTGSVYAICILFVLLEWHDAKKHVFKMLAPLWELFRPQAANRSASNTGCRSGDNTECRSANNTGCRLASNTGCGLASNTECRSASNTGCGSASNTGYVDQLATHAFCRSRHSCREKIKLIFSLCTHPPYFRLCVTRTAFWLQS